MPDPQAPTGIFDIPANPIAVAVTLDEGRTVEATIPLEGGTISATGADGTVYSLEIPADALVAPTTIGMTPVASITGMPFGNEQTYSVEFSPEGLALQNFATLTITPAQAIPLREQLTFGFQELGKELVVAPPVVDSGEIKIQVLHFSGNGVTKGLLADIEPVRERLGGSAERRLSSELSAALIQKRNQGEGGASLTDIFEANFAQYEEQVLKPRVAAAGESCAAGQLAYDTVLSYERQRQLAGLSTDNINWGQIRSVFDKMARVCVIEEFELCVQQHVIHRMVDVWLGFRRQYALLGGGGGAVLREAQELTEKCLTFKLTFQSTAKSKTYNSSVSSEIILRVLGDQGDISGEAPLVNDSFTLFAKGCDVTNVLGGGTFKVFTLMYLEERPPAPKPGEVVKPTLGKVRDLVMTYFPGNTSESANLTCQGAPSTFGPFPAWTGAFGGNHLGEVSGTGFTTTDWTILAGELYATKEWDLSLKGVEEKGSLELHHTPGA